MQYHHNDLTPGAEDDAAEATRKEQQQRFAHIGRNEPCPCGSGKKFKQCHGRLA